MAFIKQILMLTVALSISVTASAQSITDRIVDSMNRSDWFGLDSIYNAGPTDSIPKFLEVFSRCLIGNRLNRPDVSIPAFQELLNTQSESLDLNNLVSSSLMFAMDLSRTGYNKEASSMLESVIGAAGQYLDSLSLTNMRNSATLYSALAKHTPYAISFSDSTCGRIPFKIIPVGPKERNAVLMRLENSSINSMQADITFDTGAGINLISDSMAVKYGLIPTDARMRVLGIGHNDGYIAIAREMRIGDITVSDVPFCVVPFTTNNAEADQYTDCFNIVVGSELMLQLKDLTIDFDRRTITVPVTAPARSEAKPNLCFSSTMNLLTEGSILGDRMLMNIDTGAAGYGTVGKSFFDRNKTYVTENGQSDTIREAGLGGVIIAQGYNVPGMTVTLGGCSVCPPEMTVRPQENTIMGDYDCVIGVKTLMLFGKIRFNLVDFTITAGPQAKSAVTLSTGRHTSPPEIEFTAGPKPTPLQEAGFAAIAIARGLLYPDASVTPDL